MATTFGKDVFKGSGGSGFLYPESIGKIDKKQNGDILEQRGVYTFHIGNTGNSDGVRYIASGDTLICPLMDYEFTTDMTMWIKRTGTITDTTMQFGWYGQNDESVLSSKWITNDVDGISSATTNINVADWGVPRLIDYDAFNVDGTASSMQARHTAIGLRFSSAQAAGTAIIYVKIMPYRA